MVDISRIKFFVQRRYRANWPFLDGHKLESLGRYIHNIHCQKIWEKALKLSETVRHMELSLHPDFYERFTAHMDFPEMMD